MARSTSTYSQDVENVKKLANRSIGSRATANNLLALTWYTHMCCPANSSIVCPTVKTCPNGTSDASIDIYVLSGCRKCKETCKSVKWFSCNSQKPVGSHLVHAYVLPGQQFNRQPDSEKLSDWDEGWIDRHLRNLRMSKMRRNLQIGQVVLVQQPKTCWLSPGTRICAARPTVQSSARQ